MGAPSTPTCDDTPTANIIFGLVLFDLCLLFGRQRILNARRVVWYRVVLVVWVVGCADLVLRFHRVVSCAAGRLGC